MLIRREVPSDTTATRRILEMAFPTSSEADSTELLRTTGDLECLFVAFRDGVAVGCSVFFRVEAPFTALGLGAVGVIPEHRKHGIGTRLVEKGLSLARHGGWVAVFASGYPTWHRRFGFSTCDAARFSAETTINDLAVLSPRGARLPMETGYIRFPSALGGSLPVSNREEPAGGMNTPTCTPFLDPSCGSCSLGPGNTGANR